MKFRVEGMYEIDAQTVLLARRLGTDPMSLSPSGTPRLSGIPIRHFVEELHRLKPDGSPDSDIFAFVLDERRDRDRLSAGQIVELEQ
jgi:hypothetical protein